MLAWQNWHGWSFVPTISALSDASTDEDSVVGPLSFSVSDLESDTADLIVTALSSNPAVVPSDNVVLGGAGASRTVTVNPAANQFGSTTITLTVTDPHGGSQTSSFTLTVDAVNDRLKFRGHEPILTHWEGFNRFPAWLD